MRSVWTYQRQGRPGWYVGWYEHGRRKSKAIDTKILAVHYAQIKYAQINSDVFTGQINVPWTELFAEYTQHKHLLGLQPSSLYESLATLHRFEELVHPSSSRNFTQASVDTFLLERAKQSISDYTLNKDISNLLAFARWSAARHYIGEVKFKKLRVAPPVVRVLADKDLRRLLSSLVPYPTYFIRVLLAISTGLRRSDIERLNIADVDLASKTVSTFSRKTRKSMPARPLPAGTIPLMSLYLKTLPAGQVRLFADTYQSKKWNRLRIAAGVPGATFHDMRRSFSSYLARAGVGDSVIQRLLEHSSPLVTNVHYINVDPVLAAAVERLPLSRWLSPSGQDSAIESTEARR